MIVIAPGTHIHGLTLAIRFFHPEDLFEEPQALVRFGGEDFKMCQVSNIMDRFLTVCHGITSSLHREMRDQQHVVLHSSDSSSQAKRFSSEKQDTTLLLPERKYPTL